MLSKNKIKFIKSLERKKFRTEYGVFVAEGNKLVADMLGHFECDLIVAKPSWMAMQGDIRAVELQEGDEEDFRKASFLKTPQDVLAVFRLPVSQPEKANPGSELVLVLDGIQDPGNLGTIIRLADWYGIRHIICSPDTADAFAPKTVQATMGALSRVQVHYTELIPWLQPLHDAGIPIYGTFLNGEDIYEKVLTPHGILMMGNEGNGIRPETEALVSEKLYIPDYPRGEAVSESLNVALATAITCAEFRRRERYP